MGHERLAAIPAQLGDDIDLDLQFAFGLERALDGIEMYLASRARRRSVSPGLRPSR